MAFLCRFETNRIFTDFEEEEGIIELPGGAYYGELEYRMQYKAIKGDLFPF